MEQWSFYRKLLLTYQSLEYIFNTLTSEDMRKSRPSINFMSKCYKHILKTCISNIYSFMRAGICVQFTSKLSKISITTHTFGRQGKASTSNVAFSMFSSFIEHFDMSTYCSMLYYQQFNLTYISYRQTLCLSSVKIQEYVVPLLFCLSLNS